LYRSQNFLAVMRLLNTTTLKLETFVCKETPNYAILSHTWADDEILFEDVWESGWRHRISVRRKKGFSKVRDSCAQARRDGYGYIWIDTCCIDKSSSSELSEAINSMFKWYRNAKVCYAYLVDVQAADPASFEKSRWFTRGWTLQELIAPKRLIFFDGRW